MIKSLSALKMLPLGIILLISSPAATAFAATTTCVDGTNPTNLTATWNGTDTFTVQTKTGAPLCNDLTLYGSSYVLTSPDYKGGTFGSVGSYPQTLYKSVTVTLPKGTNGLQTVNEKTQPTTVVVPLSPCGNQQVDLYYGPEKTTVDVNGHKGQYIAGNIIQPFSSVVCDAGKGGVDTTTPPTVPQVLSDNTTQPVTLTDTGLNIRLTSVLAAALAGFALYVQTRRKATANISK
jgi:hypothetical protein